MSQWKITEQRDKAREQRDMLLVAITRLLYASEHCSHSYWFGDDDPWEAATTLVEEIEASK